MCNLAVARRIGADWRERTMEDDMKRFWKSKTIIFQLLTILAAVTGVVPLPADITAAIVAAINVGLRMVTSQGVSA
jgi:hypothetical protein